MNPWLPAAVSLPNYDIFFFFLECFGLLFSQVDSRVAPSLLSCQERTATEFE